MRSHRRDFLSAWIRLETRGEKRNALPAAKAVIGLADLSLRVVRRSQDLISLLYAAETRTAGFDGEDVVLGAGFGEQRPRRDETGDVVHLGPIEDAGDMVIDAVRQAENVIAERVQVSADHGGLDARLECRRERGRGAATGNSHAADA